MVRNRKGKTISGCVRAGRYSSLRPRVHLAPCCFKQCLLSSNRRRVSPTAGMEGEETRANRLGSSLGTN